MILLNLIFLAHSFGFELPLDRKPLLVDINQSVILTETRHGSAVQFEICPISLDKLDLFADINSSNLSCEAFTPIIHFDSESARQNFSHALVKQIHKDLQRRLLKTTISHSYLRITSGVSVGLAAYAISKFLKFNIGTIGIGAFAGLGTVIASELIDWDSQTNQFEKLFAILKKEDQSIGPFYSDMPEILESYKRSIQTSTFKFLKSPKPNAATY